MEQVYSYVPLNTETTNHNGPYVMKKTLQDHKEHSLTLSEEQDRARSPSHYLQFKTTR